MILVTDINFFPNETLVRLEDGEELSIVPGWEDGTQMTLDEFRNMFMLVEHMEIYVQDVEDD